MRLRRPWYSTRPLISPPPLSPRVNAVLIRLRLLLQCRARSVHSPQMMIERPPFRRISVLLLGPGASGGYATHRTIGFGVIRQVRDPSR